MNQGSQCALAAEPRVNACSPWWRRAQWPNTQCPYATACFRQNPFYWQCVSVPFPPYDGPPTIGPVGQADIAGPDPGPEPLGPGPVGPVGAALGPAPGKPRVSRPARAPVIGRGTRSRPPRLCVVRKLFVTVPQAGCKSCMRVQCSGAQRAVQPLSRPQSPAARLGGWQASALIYQA